MDFAYLENVLKIMKENLSEFLGFALKHVSNYFKHLRCKNLYTNYSYPGCTLHLSQFSIQLRLHFDVEISSKI